jgi:hypothetical protein
MHVSPWKSGDMTEVGSLALGEVSLATDLKFD